MLLRVPVFNRSEMVESRKVDLKTEIIGGPALAPGAEPDLQKPPFPI